MSALEDLQQLTQSQGMLLYRLVDLGYLTRAQVDQLINKLVSDRFAKANGITGGVSGDGKRLLEAEISGTSSSPASEGRAPAGHDMGDGGEMAVTL